MCTMLGDVTYQDTILFERTLTGNCTGRPRIWSRNLSDRQRWNTCGRNRVDCPDPLGCTGPMAGEGKWHVVPLIQLLPLRSHGDGTCVETSVWRPGEMPKPSSWMKGGSSWLWIWTFKPASNVISSKSKNSYLLSRVFNFLPDSFHIGMYSPCWMSNNRAKPLSTPPFSVSLISVLLSGLLKV